MMKRHLVLAILVFTASLLMRSTLAAQGDEKIAFHVTSVSQADATDYCTTGKCSATRFTVEGYTQDKDAAVQYVLECVETIVNEPTPHYTVRCTRVHSHSDYLVKLGADYVRFGDPPATQETEPFLAAYLIKSEKEVRKK
jgi:hypothetical protein